MIVNVLVGQPVLTLWRSGVRAGPQDSGLLICRLGCHDGDAFRGLERIIDSPRRDRGQSDPPPRAFSGLRGVASSPSPMETYREAAGVVQPVISQVEAGELALSDIEPNSAGGPTALNSPCIACQETGSEMAR